jgi:hypothetical protein
MFACAESEVKGNVTEVIATSKPQFVFVELFISKWSEAEKSLQTSIPRKGIIEIPNLCTQSVDIRRIVTPGDSLSFTLCYDFIRKAWHGINCKRIFATKRLRTICISIGKNEEKEIVAVSHLFQNNAIGFLPIHVFEEKPKGHMIGEFFQAEFRIIHEKLDMPTYIGLWAKHISKELILDTYKYFSPDTGPVKEGLTNKFVNFFFEIRLSAETFDFYNRKLSDKNSRLDNVTLEFQETIVPAVATFQIPINSSLRVKKLDKLLISRKNQAQILGKVLIKEISILTVPVTVTIEFTKALSLDLHKQGLRSKHQKFSFLLFSDDTNLKRSKQALDHDEIEKLFRNDIRGNLCSQLIGLDPIHETPSNSEKSEQFLSYFSSFSDSPQHIEIAHAFLYNDSQLISTFMGCAGSAKSSLLVKCLLYYLLENPEKNCLVIVSANSVADDLALNIIEQTKILQRQLRIKGPPPRLCRLLTDRRYRLLPTDAIIKLYTIQIQALEKTLGDKGEVFEAKKTLWELNNEIEVYKPDFSQTRQERHEANLAMHKKLKLWKDTRQELYEVFFKNQKPRIIVSTTSATAISAFSQTYMGNIDIIIADELTFCKELELWVNLHFLRKNSIVKIAGTGDTSQNCPVSFSRTTAGSLIQQSLLERISRYKNVPMLKSCYRYHSTLLNFVSEIFYDGNLKCAIQDCERSDLFNVFPWPNPIIPMAWIQISSKDVKCGYSRTNDEENRTATKCVRRALFLGMNIADIGVITMYSAARNHLSAMLFEAGVSGITEDTVLTVDSSQGISRKLVILTCQRSLGKDGEIPTRPDPRVLHQYLGYVVDKRRITVACSRMQCALIIIGDKFLLQLDPTWKSVIEYFEKNCLHDDKFLPKIDSLTQLMDEARRDGNRIEK